MAWQACISQAVCTDCDPKFIRRQSTSSRPPSIPHPPPFAARWNRIAKPPGSLGQLEKAVTQIAGLTGNPNYAINKRTVLVLCADNGVARRGVSPVDGGVTAILAENLAQRSVSVCRMAAVAKAEVIGVDMGLAIANPIPNLLDRRIAAGTADIAEGPAMNREQAITGLRHGIELVRDQVAHGCQLLIGGEIGIGNTTTASAVISTLLRRDPREMTGPGAGLSPEGVRKKVAIIRQAIAVNQPNSDDPLDVLTKLGGFDIAGLAGVFLGGARYQTPVLVDGLISGAAALVARRLAPMAQHAMLASHISAEPAARILLEALQLSPIICANLRLGEGTGAVAALPLLDMAYAVYDGMSTYEDMTIQQYHLGNGERE